MQRLGGLADALRLDDAGEVAQFSEVHIGAGLACFSQHAPERAYRPGISLQPFAIGGSRRRGGKVKARRTKFADLRISAPTPSHNSALWLRRKGARRKRACEASF